MLSSEHFLKKNKVFIHLASIFDHLLWGSSSWCLGFIWEQNRLQLLQMGSLHSSLWAIFKSSREEILLPTSAVSLDIEVTVISISNTGLSKHLSLFWGGAAYSGESERKNRAWVFSSSSSDSKITILLSHSTRILQRERPYKIWPYKNDLFTYLWCIDKHKHVQSC